MKSLRKDKNIRRALLCQRLLAAASVLQYYEAYFRFVDCTTLAKTGGISYSDAEDFSNFMGNVFGCDVDPSDYVSSEDELSNEAIESYENLQAVLGKYDDSGKELYLALQNSFFIQSSICVLIAISSLSILTPCFSL